MARNKQRLDSVREILISKHCLVCGSILVRYSINGKMERNRNFYRRMTCANNNNVRKFSDCRKKLLSNRIRLGEVGYHRHGNYKSGKHKVCKYCNKPIHKLTVSDRCYDCWQLNRIKKAK